MTIPADDAAVVDDTATSRFVIRGATPRPSSSTASTAPG